MKKTRENLLEKLLQQKRHPIRPKLVSALLSICLLLASLPAELYGFQVQAEGQEYKILSFSELPEEVRSQNVEPGTSLEELNLPGTLEAVCVPLQYEEPELAENQGQTLSDTKWKHGEGGDNLPPVTEKIRRKEKKFRRLTQSQNRKEIWNRLRLIQKGIWKNSRSRAKRRRSRRKLTALQKKRL